MYTKKRKHLIDRIGKIKYRKNHPELRFGRLHPSKQHYFQWLASYKLYFAIRAGKIKKDICIICGNSKVHGHHPDYTKPLEVIWLCPLHHKQLHTKSRSKTKQVTKP